MAAQFTPVMVKSHDNLKDVPLKEGQYIVVIDSNEIYLDRKLKSDASIVRDRLSYRVTIGETEPIDNNVGDLWLELE